MPLGKVAGKVRIAVSLLGDSSLYLPYCHDAQVHIG